MASFSLAPPAPGERFTFVYLPADPSKRVHERSLGAAGGLENDSLSKLLRSQTSEIGPDIDITALTVPSEASGFLAVSMYQNGNADAAALPVNRWAMGLMRCCGIELTSEVRGDAFVSRYADDDDNIWRRVDLGARELMPDAAWVVAARAANQGRTAGDTSLSGILEQHLAKASQKAAENNNANAGKVVATNLDARANDDAGDVTNGGGAGGGVARGGDTIGCSKDVGVGMNDGGGDDEDDWLVGVNLPKKSTVKGRVVAISLGGPAAETPTTRDGGQVDGAGQDRKSDQKKKKKEKEKRKKYVSIRR